ncbi:hypothetical protein A3780_20460 [Kosakonia radicincitans]|uniref:LysR substrate-binding domain-containing protein n=1 Tax=Kosakonia radicincitans TaxID=283686 RepID=UPI0009040689|nr:LysR substrate-binding domain-containing protein [Kosakonia radicincitans]APG19819.1 hypothetical protein A3780_20460 [Kosakonia radicincitans]
MNDKIPDLQDMVYIYFAGKSLNMTIASTSSGIPLATLSRRISVVEKRLGLKFFIRTSRGLILTEPGKHYIERAEAIIKDVVSLEDEVKSMVNNPSGTINITCPVDFGVFFIAPQIKNFSKLYPSIRLNFNLSTQKLNIPEHEIDICIRIGDIRDLNLVSRAEGILNRKLYASPVYIEKFGKPTHPDELLKHQCIGPSYMKEPTRWTLCKGDEAISLNVAVNYSANNIAMMLKLTESDCGISVLTPEVISDSLSKGNVVPVLPEWSFPPLPVYILTGSRHISKSARIFIDYLVDVLDDIFCADLTQLNSRLKRTCSP